VLAISCPQQRWQPESLSEKAEVKTSLVGKHIQAEQTSQKTLPATMPSRVFSNKQPEILAQLISSKAEALQESIPFLILHKTKKVLRGW